MQQYVSKVDIVYESFLEDLLEGNYKKNDRLIIKQIANKYNVSETPVREALRRLESEGHVRVIANQGAIVSGYNRERLLNLVQNKGVLEAYATRLSIDYITPEMMAELREINERFRIAYENNDVRAYSHENEAFHMKIYQCGPNKDLYRLIRSMWKMWVINKLVFSIILSSASVSVQEHEQILQMIAEKKYDTIEDFVRHHKMRSGLEVVNYVTARGDI